MKIIYARAYTYEHQYNLLLGLAAKMAEEPFRLLVSHYQHFDNIRFQTLGLVADFNELIFSDS